MKSFVSGYAHVPWSVWFIFLEMKRVEAFEYKEILWRFPIMCKISPGSDSVSFSWQSPEPSNIDHDLNTDFFNCHMNQVKFLHNEVMCVIITPHAHRILFCLGWLGVEIDLCWISRIGRLRPGIFLLSSTVKIINAYLPTIDMNQKYLFLS